MSNLKQVPKPNSDITDYEWSMTPPAVKAIVNRWQQLLQHKQKTLEQLESENQWLREQLDLQLDKPSNFYKPSLPEVILWAAIGLILTIGSTFVQAYTIAAPWFWQGGVEVKTLGVSYQIGAVLLIACLGGKNAALLSQLAYVGLGLIGLPVFDRGGGLEYLQEPSFGYLIGFILGSWVCGLVAFKTLVKLSSLILSCFLGLVVIHVTGIIYLTGIYYTVGLGERINSLFQAISIYSFHPFPSQLAVICAASLIAFVMRKLMFA